MIFVKKKAAGPPTGKVTNREKFIFTDRIVEKLKKKFGKVKCPLHYAKPHELVIAVILSAQCTDERVNMVTGQLFDECPNLIDYVQISPKKLEKLIYSTGFYRNKTRHIQGVSRILLSKFQGNIPSDVQTLISMSGIGRKTANVIVQELYKIPSGIVVDTHVARLAKLLYLTEQRFPPGIERDLQQQIRKRHWIRWSLYMIYLGRFSCKARSRKCDICPLKDICPSRE